MSQSIRPAAAGFVVALAMAGSIGNAAAQSERSDDRGFPCAASPAQKIVQDRQGFTITGAESGPAARLAPPQARVPLGKNLVIDRALLQRPSIDEEAADAPRR